MGSAFATVLNRMPGTMQAVQEVTFSTQIFLFQSGLQIK